MLLTLVATCDSNSAVEEEAVGMCDTDRSDGPLCSDDGSSVGADAISLTCEEIVEEGADIYHRAKACQRDADCILKAVEFPMICHPSVNVETFYSGCQKIAVNRTANFDRLSVLNLTFFAPEFWRPDVDPCVRQALCGTRSCRYESPRCVDGYCEVEWEFWE